MPGTGPVAYASVADLFGAPAGYLASPSVAQNSVIAQTLLNVASRFIDEKCGRFFYDDGYYVRYFNQRMPSREITIWPDAFGKAGTIGAVAAGATSLTYTLTYGAAPIQGDVLVLDVTNNLEKVTINGVVTGTGPYTCPIAATQFGHIAGTLAASTFIQFGFYENQPLPQWVTVPGDGYTPGLGNWYAWPDQPKPIATGTSLIAPWQGFDLPLIPVSNTTYLPTPRPGARTVAITAHWGYPIVPDLIRDITLKLAARAWEHRGAGWQAAAGDDESSGGGLNMSHHFDTRDEEILIASGYVRWAV
jgi:hypothetical protein